MLELAGSFCLQSHRGRKQNKQNQNGAEAERKRERDGRWEIPERCACRRKANEPRHHSFFRQTNRVVIRLIFLGEPEGVTLCPFLGRSRSPRHYASHGLFPTRLLNSDDVNSGQAKRIRDPASCNCARPFSSRFPSLDSPATWPSPRR